PERNCWVDVYLDAEHMERRLLDSVWSWIEDAAEAEGGRVFNAACGEDEPEMLEVLAQRGYERKSTERVWRLDLEQHGAQLVANAAAARERMHTGGIALTTLDRWHDRERFAKLHTVHELLRLDVPHISPILPQTLEDFVVRLEAPSTAPDRFWVALDGAEPVAMSYLAYPPVRGFVWTSFTGSHPGHRGPGTAR